MMLSLDGTRLHVEVLGPADAPAILFVHGGPGQGAHDFVSAVGEEVAVDLRLVAVDQRGALRSDPLPPSGRLTVDDLVADFEAVRQRLRIDRWCVLGHSFGARIALRYALDRPDALSGLMAENPEWDGAISARAQLGAALPMLDRIGRIAAADEVRRLLATELVPGPELWRTRRRLLGELGTHRLELSVRDPVLRDRLTRDGFPSATLPAELTRRGARHGVRLVADAGTHEPLLPRLAELTVPLLLLAGAHDPLTHPDVVDGVRAAGGHVHRFAHSGHFVHFEEPTDYAAAVRAVRPSAIPTRPDRERSIVMFDEYDALSFDCYGTLIDWESGAAAVLGPWIRRFEPNTTDDAVLATFGEEQVRLQRARPTMPYPELLAEAFRGTGERLACPVTEPEARRLGASVPDWPAFEDSHGALEALKRRYRLIIVSNVDGASFEGSRRRLDIDFDHVITAEDVGSYKPADRHFEAVTAYADRHNLRLLHVAESLFHDHVPAHRFGLPSVWIHRGHDRPGARLSPDIDEPASPDWEYPSMAAFAAAVRASAS